MPQDTIQNSIESIEQKNKNKVNKIVAIQADSLSQISVEKESTILIMNELLSRDYQIFWYEAKNLFMLYSSPHAFGFFITKQVIHKDDISSFNESKIKQIDLLSVSMILIRQNPPFDMNYLYSLQLLSIIQNHVVVLNNPKSLAIYGEKLIPFYIKNGKFLPKTIITSSCNTSNYDTIKNFFSQNKTVVLKDLWGYSGIGVKKVTQEENLEDFMKNQNTNQLLRAQDLEDQEFKNQQVVIQEFLPEIYAGDIRVTFVNGEILCAIQKVPAKGNFISNTCAGGTVYAVKQLSESVMEICKEVSNFLVKEDIFFAGIDVVADRLLEVNITSVGLLFQSNIVHNTNFTKILVDKMEAKML